MRDLQIGEEQRDNRNEHPDEQATQYASGHMADDDRRVGHRRDEHLFEVATELGAEE